MTMTARRLLRTRPLTTADLPAAQALSRAVGWPHRVEDWAFVLALGEGIAIDAGDELVGTAIAWKFGPSGGALGMVIVAPAHQGQGIGRQLMEALLPGLEGRAIALTATVEGQPLYAKLGFVPTGSIRQHQGTAFAVGFHPPRLHERIRPAGRADLPVLTALDSAATGMARGVTLAALMEAAECIVLDRDGVASGFAALRRFGRGQLIGPVIAPDAEAARLLVAHFVSQRQGDFLRIDVSSESGLSDWLTEAGLPAVDELPRMVRGTPPMAAAVGRFALINQALG